MGTKVKCSLSVIESICKSNAPTIICDLSNRYLINVSELSDETISLNLILAKNLLKFEMVERTDYVQSEIMNILTKNRTILLLKDFEMLFDPRYKIDVVKLISDVSRWRKIIAIWPGSISENSLMYAVETASDYQVYDIKNYDILSVY